jgi:hypothetical protein
MECVVMSDSKCAVVLAAGLVTTLFHVSVGAAQPADGELVEPSFDPPPSPPEPEPEPAPAPVVEAVPAPAPAPTPPAVVAPLATVAPAPTRPVGVSLGLGLGYRVPADVMAPTESSARIRLENGITLEPRLSISYVDQTVGSSTESTDSTTELGAVLDVRVPVRTRSKVDLVAIVGGGVAQVTEDRNNGDATRTTSVIELHYGLGVEYWLSSQWVISFTTTNPIVARTSQSEDDELGTPYEETGLGFGAIFAPNVNAMIHLFL